MSIFCLNIAIFAILLSSQIGSNPEFHKNGDGVPDILKKKAYDWKISKL